MRQLNFEVSGALSRLADNLTTEEAAYLEGVAYHMIERVKTDNSIIGRDVTVRGRELKFCHAHTQDNPVLSTSGELQQWLDEFDDMERILRE